MHMYNRHAYLSALNRLFMQWELFLFRSFRHHTTRIAGLNHEVTRCDVYQSKVEGHTENDEMFDDEVDSSSCYFQGIWRVAFR